VVADDELSLETRQMMDEIEGIAQLTGWKDTRQPAPDSGTPGRAPVQVSAADAVSGDDGSKWLAVLSPEWDAKFKGDYIACIAMFRDFGITVRDSITAIDGKSYTVPDWLAIKQSLTVEQMQAIQRLDSPRLILTPFGMPLRELVKKVMGQRGAFLEPQRAAEFDMVFQADVSGEMRYHSQSFEEGPGKTPWKKKTDFLQVPKLGMSGWSVVVIEGAQRIDPASIEIPSEEGFTKIASVSKSPKELLEEYQQAGYWGPTPEDWLVLQAIGIRTGEAIDMDKPYTGCLGANIYTNETNLIFVCKFYPVNCMSLRLALDQVDDGSVGSRRVVRIPIRNNAS